MTRNESTYNLIQTRANLQNNKKKFNVEYAAISIPKSPDLYLHPTLNNNYTWNLTNTLSQVLFLLYIPKGVSKSLIHDCLCESWNKICVNMEKKLSSTKLESCFFLNWC